MGFVPQYSDYISQVRLPGYSDASSPNYNKTFYIKDSEAREWIEQLASAGLKFTVAWDGESVPDVTKIPLGVTVRYQNIDYTGTLVADETTAPFITLVYERTSGTGANARKIYGEYITVTEGSGESGDPYTYFWEKLGNTDIVLDDLGDLAYKDSVTLNKGTGDNVLGESTTFTNGTSEVTMAYGTTTGFVKSYPGVTSKLATTTITGVSGSTTASKATAGTAITYGNANVSSSTITCAKAASSATSISYIGNASTSSVLQSASVANECLSFGDVSVSQGSVTGTNGTETFNTAVTSTSSLTPYSFDDVTVPIAAGSATTVATGSLSSTATGDSVMTGLGTATTESAVTSVGTGSSTATGTAAAQTITVGTNDKVKVAIYNDLSVTVS